MMRRIELIPESYIRRRQQRRTLGMIWAGGVALLLALVAFGVFTMIQVSSAKRELADVQARNSQLQTQIAELQRFADLEAEVQAKQEALTTVMGGDVDWPALLTEVAMVVPGELWLESLTGSAGTTEGATQVGTETAPVRVTSETPFGRVQFTGKSLTMNGIARWLTRQESSRQFEAVFLTDATEDEDKPVFTFDSTIELNDKSASSRFEGGQL